MFHDLILCLEIKLSINLGQVYLNHIFTSVWMIFFFMFIYFVGVGLIFDPSLLLWLTRFLYWELQYNNEVKSWRYPISWGMKILRIIMEQTWTMCIGGGSWRGTHL